MVGHAYVVIRGWDTLMWLYEGGTRLCGGSRQKKDLDVNIIKALIDKFNKQKLNLLKVRSIIVVLLRFAGFFRIDEYPFSGPHSKTDQHRQGSKVIIARTKTAYCHVAFAENILQ